MMKRIKKSFRGKSKYLGMVVALLIIITSSITTNSLVMKDFNNIILDSQPNNVSQNNDYHTDLQRVEEANNDIEIKTTSSRSELLDNNFSGKKISQSHCCRNVKWHNKSLRDRWYRIFKLDRWKKHRSCFNIYTNVS